MCIFYERKVEMSVRKQHNRYRTEPFGTDFNDVVKRAKAFYKSGVFGICQYGNVYSTFTPSIVFKDPDETIYYKYIEGAKRGKWISYRKDLYYEVV